MDSVVEKHTSGVSNASSDVIRCSSEVNMDVDPASEYRSVSESRVWSGQNEQVSLVLMSSGGDVGGRKLTRRSTVRSAWDESRFAD